ncbi:galectin-3 isoform X2 [Microcaecilia unicolor]|uniref:Galectin n=1 Tax=Microcaecilia unicolor TaxID=1415580 RepID=A0A6P7YZS4_9AMPH|nr:galectin-3-like isoform X2 [Microcaecilia unicolor]
MADDLSLADALSGNSQNSNQPQQNQGWLPAPWGPPNPGVWPAPGQPGMFPGPAPGQPGMFPGQVPGQPGSFPGQVPGQPGSFPGPAPGQPGSFPGPAPDQPGFPQPPNPFGAPAEPTPKPKDPFVPLTIPYQRPLTAGVMPQLLITVQGTVKAKPHRFAVDLRKNNDVALHLNPRFDKRPHTIVRNTMINNIWGEEEKHTPKFPFQHGKPFKIQILCETNHFRVAINNEHLFQYNHRIKELKEINKLCIDGDITLTNVEVTMA